MVSPSAFGRGLVLALVVCVAALPACVPVPRGVVGPELPVSRPVPGSPRGAKEQAVAYGRGVFVVAWVDDRDDLWVTRVDRNGAVIDPSGIRLSTEYSSGPAVAFDGTNFLVVWNGFGPVRGRRVSPGGMLLDPEPIELSTPSTGVFGPEVSFGGGSYLVVWAGHDGEAATTDVFGTRLSPAGVVLQPANVPIVTPPGDQSQVDIAFDGTHHLVVWDQGDPSSTDIHGTLVSTDGVAVGPDRPISTAVGQQRRPVVTATGSGFFVAWLDRREDFDIFAARLRADGSVVDDPGIGIGHAQDTDFLDPHDVSWDGVNALVTWQPGRLGADDPVRGVRVDPSGTLLDPAGVELASGRHPASAFDGTHHLLTSLTRPAGSVTGTRLTPGLAPLDPQGFRISVGANGQHSVDMVSDGVNHFVVWTDNRTGQSAVYGARVGPDGQNLDGAGFPISAPGGPSTGAGVPSVAFDGTNFLVVWVEASPAPGAVRAARVSRSGTVVGRFDIAPMSASFDAPEVAFGNGVFLVGWVRFEDVMVTRVGTDGTVLDPGGIQLSSFMTTLADIDIAAGASEFLVVWNNGRSVEPDDDNDVFGAVVTPGGTVSHIPIAHAPAPTSEDHPSVAWHNGTYLVVWTHAVDNDGDGLPDVSDIHGTRLLPSGTVLDPDPLLISTAPGDQQQPDVAFNGRFLVTWADRRRVTDPGDPGAEVIAAPVQPDGTVGPEFVVAVTDLYTGDAVVSAIPGDDKFGVVYGRYLPEAPYGTTRTFLRRVSPK